MSREFHRHRRWRFQGAIPRRDTRAVRMILNEGWSADLPMSWAGRCCADVASREAPRLLKHIGVRRGLHALSMWQGAMGSPVLSAIIQVVFEKVQTSLQSQFPTASRSAVNNQAFRWSIIEAFSDLARV